MRWEKVRLGDVCTTTSGGTPSRKKDEYYGGAIPWVKSGELNQTPVIETSEFLTELGVQNSSAKIQPSGTVLLALYGATIGKSSILGIEAATNQAICCIQVTERIENKFLLAFLRHKIKDIINLGVGGAQPNISQEIVRNIEIPLPPLSEQKRLAAILDRADELRRVRRKVLLTLDELAQSLFLELFGDPLNPSESSEFVTLSSVADIIMGQSPPGTSYNFDGNGTPLLNGPTEFGVRFPTEKQWTTEAKKLCAKDDIIFCVRGATAGKLNTADKTYCLGRGVASIRTKKQKSVTNEFLYAVLKHYYPYFQAQGVGSTFINISGEELKKLRIPKVELKCTHQFAAQIAELETIKTRARASLTELDALFASLQSRAFAGEL